MPLTKSASKKAFSHNVSEMMHHGHPQAQSLAAAYATKRSAAAKHRKRMADGGAADAQTLGEAIGYPGSKKSKMMARGGYVRIEAPKPEGGMKMHDSEDTEYGKGMPGMRTPEPMEDDEMHQQKLPGEMNRMPNGSVKMAPYQHEADEYTDTTSEMGHFARGGYVPEEIEGAMHEHDMEDSEYGRGQPGSTMTPMQSHLEEENMRSDADGIRPGGSIRMASYQDEADEYADSSSEMDHFADGGLAHRMAGNAKLQQAYKSIHEKVMAKHKMADGGDVDIELNAMEEGEDSLGSSPLDKMDRHAADTANYDAGMKEKYGDDGEDEMHGESILDRIRRKRMAE